MNCCIKSYKAFNYVSLNYQFADKKKFYGFFVFCFWCLEFRLGGAIITKGYKRLGS